MWKPADFRMLSRRDFLRTSAAGATSLTLSGSPAWAQGRSAPVPGERPPAPPDDVRVVNPRSRTALSMIIDDSTCLVNLAYFGIPQFAQVFPNRYQQPWKSLPREIPDSFVRKFGEWCREHDVKGKYSIVPYPACVGWIDREMPGWSSQELQDSLELVRSFMTPNWDNHPEMLTHTWVIDLRTGRPYPEKSEYTMENWRWTDGKSVDELAGYMAYSLRLLKNVGLPCEGITTPGGFGNRVLAELSQATLQACRDVFSAEIPHYFRHLFTDDRSVAPRVEYASGLKSNDPQCCVSIIGCTGDWFGGWDGLTPGSVDQFISEDLQSGRLVDIIGRGEPAILVCHWPGIYYNGEELGFNIFKEIVRRLNERYDQLYWMKLSEIARYWAARELTHISKQNGAIALHAPFACPSFTLEIDTMWRSPPIVEHPGGATKLSEVAGPLQLKPGCYCADGKKVTACFDLGKGDNTLRWEM